MEQTDKRPTGERVYEAACGLFEQGLVVTRHTLKELLDDLSLTVIDDRLKVLVDDGRLVRVKRGVFMPAVRHAPARVISKTVMGDGAVVLDIGDTVLQLTPREAMVLGQLLMGDAMLFGQMGIGHQLAQMSGDLACLLRRESKSGEKGLNHEGQQGQLAIG